MRMDKGRIILISVAAVLVIVLTVLVIVALGDLAEQKKDRPQETVPPMIQLQPDDDKIIETPFGTLVFPGTWVQYLKVERVEEPELEIRFSASFPSGKNQKLFDIRFGEARDTAVGQVVTTDGVVVGVHVTVHPFKPDGGWSAKESAAITDMQDCVTRVVKGLNMVPVGTPVPELQGEEVTIETPYCTLYFPGRWKEELKLSLDESDGYSLIFSAVIGSHEEQQLFTVNFGGSADMGQSVGVVKTENDIPVVIRVKNFAQDLTEWNPVARSTITAMQEDLNHLLMKLPQE